MRYMMKSVGMLFGVSLLVSSSWAYGYQHKHAKNGDAVRWHQTTIKIKFQAQMANTSEGRQRVEEIKASFGKWEKALQGRVQFKMNGYKNNVEMGYDPDHPNSNENAMIWVDKNWQEHPDTMAVTLISYRENSGEIVDADIAFNGEYYRWYVASNSPGLTQYWGPSSEEKKPMIEVGNTAMHEIGHFLGLSHSEELEATMFRSQGSMEESKRELHQDDILGIHKLYEANEAANSLGQSTKDQPLMVGVGCSMSGSSQMPGRGQLWVGLLLCGLLFFSRRRSRKNHLGAALLAVGLIAMGGDAWATTGVSYSLDSLAHRAGLVVSGQVRGQRSVWLGKRIYTLSTVRIEQCHKGKCQQKEVVVQQLGGASRGIRMQVEGIALLKPQEKVLLFLYSSHARARLQGQVRSVHRVVGLSHGVFRFQQRKAQTWVISDRRGLSWIPAPSSPTTTRLKQPTHAKQGPKLLLSMPLTDLLKRVKRACLNARSIAKKPRLQK